MKVKIRAILIEFLVVLGELGLLSEELFDVRVKMLMLADFRI